MSHGAIIITYRACNAAILVATHYIVYASLGMSGEPAVVKHSLLATISALYAFPYRTVFGLNTHFAEHEILDMHAYM